MNVRVDYLLGDALGLPADERSALAAALLDSLEGSDDPTISEAWRRELVRRRDELRAGALKSQPWAEVRNRLTAR